MSLKIKKSKSFKSWPQLVIVEGFWRMGKSTLIRELIKKGRFNLIREPNHLIEAPSVKDPHQWYFKKHLERQSLAREIMTKKGKVIMERSILANIAFDYADRGKVTKKNEKILKSLPELKQFPIIFLYTEKQLIKNAIQNLKDNFVKNIFAKNEKFYTNYINFYKNILKEITGNSAFCIDVAPRAKFLKPQELIKKLEIEMSQSDDSRKKVRETCAAAALIHKNKILLLYDRNWNHYVLPQGHIETGENLRQAAIREVKEETGYSDLRLIKKVKQYQYHYPNGNKIIYKTVHVFLIKILSLASCKKMSNEHENYVNHFVGFRDAIKLARWPQDQKLIRLVRDYQKK